MPAVLYSGGLLLQAAPTPAVVAQAIYRILDATQLILAIVANIIAAIIMWACTRLTRGARNSLMSGTVTEKVSNIFAPNKINILVSNFIFTPYS